MSHDPTVKGYVLLTMLVLSLCAVLFASCSKDEPGTIPGVRIQDGEVLRFYENIWLIFCEDGQVFISSPNLKAYSTCNKNPNPVYENLIAHAEFAGKTFPGPIVLNVGKERQVFESKSGWSIEFGPSVSDKGERDQASVLISPVVATNKK